MIRERLGDDEGAVLTQLAETLEDTLAPMLTGPPTLPPRLTCSEGALAEVLAGRIRETRERDPCTSLLMHLDGAWGWGKSTLLSTCLTGAGFLVMWFDAWQHSRRLWSSRRRQVSRSTTPMGELGNARPTGLTARSTGHRAKGRG